MSAIVGIVRLDGRPVEPTELDGMLEPLAHRGATVGRWVDGPAAVGCRLHRGLPGLLRGEEPQPFRGRGLVVVLDGRLDGRETIRCRLAKDVERRTPSGARSPSDAELLAGLLGEEGEEGLGTLRGDFSAAVWDRGRRRLILVRDPIGARPLYFTRAAGALLFATEIKALLAHSGVSAAPDDAMIADFLLGHVHDRWRTFFEGIRALPPGHAVAVGPEATRSWRTWDFPRAVSDADGLDFEEVSEEFGRRFRTSVRRRLRSDRPVVVSVSGGLDSSAIFCVADALVSGVGAAAGGRVRDGVRAPDLLGISYVAPHGSDAHEAEFLPLLEETTGRTIERLPTVPGLLDGTESAVWHVEVPWLDGQWNTTRAFFETAAASGAGTVLSGHWADQLLFPQAYLVDMVRRGRWGQVRRHLGEFSRWMTDVDERVFARRFLLDLVKFHVPRRWQPAIRRLRIRRDRPWVSDRLRRVARRRAWSDPAHTWPGPSVHARSLYEEVRSAHHVMSMEWDNKVAAMHGIDWSFPFLDRDLAELLLTIPGRLLSPEGVPKGLLRQGLRDDLPAPVRDRRWKADFTDLINEGMRRGSSRFEDWRSSFSMCLEYGYLETDDLEARLRRLVEEMPGEGTLGSESLADLLGLESWLRVFFGDGSRSPGGSAAGHARPGVVAARISPTEGRRE